MVSSSRQESKTWVHESLAYFVLVFVSAIWGVHGVVGKSIGHDLSSFQLTVWRFTFGALLYFPFLHRITAILRLGRPVLIQLAVTGISLCVIHTLLLYESLRTLSPVAALLLINTAPFFAAVFAHLIFNEKLSWLSWTGVFVSFLGVVVLVLAQWGGATSLIGIVYALISAISFAVYIVSSRSLFQSLPLIDVMMATSVIGAVCLWVLVPFCGGVNETISSLGVLDTQNWLELAYIVLLVNFLGYFLNGYGLKNIPAGIASALTLYPQPIFAALAQWLWLGLMPSLTMLFSVVLIFGGSAIMRRGQTIGVHDTAKYKAQF